MGTLVPSNTKVQPSGKGSTIVEITHDPSPKPIHNTQSVSSIPQSVRERGAITAQQYVEESWQDLATNTQEVIPNTSVTPPPGFHQVRDDLTILSP